MTSASSKAPLASFSAKSGFLATCMTSPAAAGAPDATVAHSFGRLGQGPLAGGKPFYWGTAATANTPGMMIGAYPSTDAETGPAASTTVTIAAS